MSGKRGSQHKQPQQKGPQKALSTSAESSDSAESVASKVQAIVFSEFDCADHHRSTEVDRQAENQIRLSCNEASVDYNHEPIRWGNSRGLTILERFDRMDAILASHESRHASHESRHAAHESEIASLKKEVASHKTTITSQKDDIVALKATTETYYAARSRFFAVYIRDSGTVLSQEDRKLIHQGNIAAHEGNPVVDAMMFKRSIRTDESTFIRLYGLGWSKVLEYGVFS